MLDQDAEGGADGDLRFRWAQPHAVALARIAFRAVARDLGPGPHPAVVMDASSENGDTPVGFNPKPHGRHPGSSHDGGLNLDLGYYLSSLKGKVFTPDYAASSEHFKVTADGENKDAYRCLAAADRLDVPRTARLFVELFKIHRENFNGDLLEEIGVDFQVRQPVIAQVKAWAQEGKYGCNSTMVKDMEMIMTCDEANGWAGSHHHHLHLRIRDFPLYGAHRPAVQALEARARREEFELIKDKSRPVLSAALLSSDLSRCIEAELQPSPLNVKVVKFRVNGGEWVAAQPGDPRNRAVLELPPGMVGGQALVEVEGQDQEDKPFKQNLTVELPSQDPRLCIAVETAQIKAAIRETADSVAVQPQIPPTYRVWVTETSLLLHREGRAPEKRVLTDASEQTVDRKGLMKVELQVLCSGRKVVKNPVWVALHD